MSTVIPLLAAATLHARLHPATSRAALASASARTPATGELAIFVLILGLVFLAVAIRTTRQLVALISQFFQVAAAVGGTLIMIIIVAALIIALLLH
jgi:hypothetical protein